MNPGDSALALAKGARDRGARFVLGSDGRRASCRAPTATASSASRPTEATIEADTVVLAAGLWTSELARLAGASVPLYPAEHVWVMTEPAEGAREEAPFLRDLDGYLYVRHYRGGYRRRGVRAARQADRGRTPSPPTGSSSSAPTGTTSRRCSPTRATASRSSRRSGSRTTCAHRRASRPTPTFQLGELPEAPGLWVAAGLNSQGIIYAPGVGMALAEWIVEGHPTYDLAEVDVARDGPWANNRRWLHERTVESLGGLYEMHWPGKQPETARGVRRIPFSTAP